MRTLRSTVQSRRERNEILEVTQVLPILESSGRAATSKVRRSLTAVDNRDLASRRSPLASGTEC